MSNGPGDLSEQINAIRDHKWLIILALLAAAAGSLIVHWLQTPTYKAAQTVSISRGIADTLETDNSLNEFLSDPKILNKVITELRLEISVSDLQKKVHIQRVSQTRLAVISATDPKRNVARQIARSLADGFVQETKKLDPSEQLISGSIDAIEEQLHGGQKITEQISETKARLSAISSDRPTDDPRAAYVLGLRQRLSSLEERQTDLLIQKQQLELEQVSRGVNQVLTPAHLEMSDTSPGLGRTMAAALIAALLGASVLALAMGPRENQGTS